MDDRAARLVIGHAAGPLPNITGALPRGWPRIEPLASYQADGIAEAKRLDAERVVAPGPRTSIHVWPNDEGPLATIVRNTTTRTRLGARVLLIWEVAVEDGCGRRTCSRAVATAISLTRLPRERADAVWIDGLVEWVTPDVLAQIEGASTFWRTRAIAAVRSFIATRVAREHDVAAAVPPAAFQPGLFDRRGHHAQAAARAVQQQMADSSARRMVLLERRAALSILPPALRLVLIP